MLFPANVGRTQRRRDTEKVERAIGCSLKAFEEIHHHTDGALVVCENHTYHLLLHRRTKALRACGHASWRKCQFCGEYDDPENMAVYGKRRQVHHTSCKNKYTRAWRFAHSAQKQLTI